MRVIRVLFSALLLFACSGAPEAARAPSPVPEESPAPPPWEGRYTLATDRGQGLPGGLAPTSDCAVELLAGSLTLSGSRFLLVTTHRERCREVGTRQESAVSEGSVEVAGDSLRLQGEPGSAFIAAHGHVARDMVRVLSLVTGDSTLLVEWTFSRQ